MVYTRSMMMKKKKTMKAKANNQTYSNLPFDLTLLILQRMSSKDNIRASSVCKTWQEACVSVRVDEYPTPWLMHFPSDKEEYELYDPSLDKTHIRKSSPELRGAHIRYSRDGWLLMHDTNITETFFFNPFTRERIQIPWPELRVSHVIAFSSAPTSDSCVIFSVRHISKTHIAIKTYRPATRVCTDLSLPHRLPLPQVSFQQFVFSDGVFYCLTNIGRVGMFDLSTNSWHILPRLPPKCLRTKYQFLSEYQGDIFLVYTNTHDLEEPMYVKLDLANRKWTDEEKLRSLRFYLSFMSSLTTSRDLVYTKKISKYNFSYGNSGWIKPPINVSDLFTS